MLRTQKETQIQATRQKFSKAASAVFTDFRGLDVESVNELRREFQKAEIEYKVVKNTLTKIALAEEAYQEKLSDYLVGPTAIAWSYEDPVVPAKILVDFAKSHEKLTIKCGVLDGEVLDPEGVKALSKMPGKDELKGTLLATFIAPAQGMVRLLAAPATNFLYLLSARQRQLEE